MNEAEILRLVGKQSHATDRHIYNEAAKLIAKADQHYRPLKGLVVPEFRYDLKGRTAGTASARYKTDEFWIRLNNDALLNPELKDYMLNQTLPHEIAHTVVQQLWPTELAHGWKWKEVMHLFGVEPDRTHNLPLQKARKTRRFVHICLKCFESYNIGLNAHRKLVINPIHYKCSKCGGRLDQNGREL